MFNSAVCSVHIDSPSKKGYWSDGEEVSGLIEVDVRREIQIASIEAQLRCEEKGRVYTKDNEEVVDISAFHFDNLEILWSSNLKEFQVPSNNGQLPKGKHKFPFSFQLPQNCHDLPSSFNVEPKHDFNGVFWGVYAFINRDARLRSNYRGFGEIKMFPRIHYPELDPEVPFISATHTLHLKSHRRPTFMISDGERKLVSIQGEVAVPGTGFIQRREMETKRGAEPSQLRLSMQCGDANTVMIKEIIVFVDTTLLTLAKEKQGLSRTVAIAAQVEISEIVVAGSQWLDLTNLLGDFRIYGLPETWESNIHKVEHTIRVQFVVALVTKPGRTSILEVQVPVKLLSEAVSDSNQLPPPPYDTAGLNLAEQTA